MRCIIHGIPLGKLYIDNRDKTKIDIIILRQHVLRTQESFNIGVDLT